ncbi:MAG: DVU_1557 family redox protein [Lentihominibacter sp.]|jgi:hypothetical protein
MSNKTDSSTSAIICSKCLVPLEPIDVTFRYLGKQFHHKVDRCPKCGQVFISEDLAKGRMAEVEKVLEEK